MRDTNEENDTENKTAAEAVEKQIRLQEVWPPTYDREL